MNWKVGNKSLTIYHYILHNVYIIKWWLPEFRVLMNDGDQDSNTTFNSIMTLSVPHLQGVVVNIDIHKHIQTSNKITSKLFFFTQ